MFLAFNLAREKGLKMHLLLETQNRQGHKASRVWRAEIGFEHSSAHCTHLPLTHPQLNFYYNLCAYFYHSAVAQSPGPCSATPTASQWWLEMCKFEL